MATQTMPAPHGDHRLKCGGCRWFVTGIEGKTCQQTRGVLSETRACIEFQKFVPSPFEILTKDKFLIEMRKTLLVWTDSTIKKFDAEIKSYRLLKSEVALKDPMSYVEEGKLAELGQRFETIQAYSERLLDIRYELMDKRTELNGFAKDVQSYLLAEYREMVQSLKNDSERGAFMRKAAPELHRAMESMENLFSKAELAYQILKDAHFAMSRKQDAVLELWRARQASVQIKNRGNTVG